MGNSKFVKKGSFRIAKNMKSTIISVQNAKMATTSILNKNALYTLQCPIAPYTVR